MEAPLGEQLLFRPLGKRSVGNMSPPSRTHPGKTLGALFSGRLDQQGLGLQEDGRVLLPGEGQGPCRIKGYLLAPEGIHRLVHLGKVSGQKHLLTGFGERDPLAV